MKNQSAELIRCIEAIYVACNATTKAAQLDIIHKLGRQTDLLREVPLPEDLVRAAFICGNAQDYEQEARIAWRLSDYCWRHVEIFGLAFPRALNNYVQDLGEERKYPWVKDLWSQEEIAEIRKSYGMPAA